MPSVVDAKGVSKEFGTSVGIMYQLLRGEPPVNLALDRVTLSVDKGETLALVGESGCGKTTFGRIICMLERPTGGTILLDGEDITQISEQRRRRLRSKVQMIFQNPYDALDPRQTVRSLVEQPLVLQRVGDSSEREVQVREVISEVGLRPPKTFLDRHPHELSGGQRQRVAIARAVILEPAVVIADEPVSMLDVSVRSGILNLMMDMKDRLGGSLLFITHDLSVAHCVSDRIAVMYLGSLMEMGPTDLVVDRPVHPYTRFLLAAVPRLPWKQGHAVKGRRERVRLIGEASEQAARERQACKFASRCPLARPVCFSKEPAGEHFRDDHYVACHFAEESSRLKMAELLVKAASRLEGCDGRWTQ